MSRLGQVWEVDLSDSGFSDEAFAGEDVITFVVVGRADPPTWNVWGCRVLVATRFEAAGQPHDRPEDGWELRPSKYRRLA